MKKDYVNLKVQVIEVQLSDCIAGSIPVLRNTKGRSSIHEVDLSNKGISEGGVTFSGWGK